MRIYNQSTCRRSDNEEKIRREAAGIEGADCEFYVTKAVGDATEFVRNWCKEHAGEEVRVYRLRRRATER